MTGYKVKSRAGLFLVAFLIILGVPMVTTESARGEHLRSTVSSRDEGFVRSACRLWWNLPDPRSTSAKDMQSWARKARPTLGKALSEAAKAKKINIKWYRFELEMLTFWGAVRLGEDIRYSQGIFSLTTVQKALGFLTSVCRGRI